MPGVSLRKFNVFYQNGELYRGDDGTFEFPRDQAEAIAESLSGVVEPASRAACAVQAKLNQHTRTRTGLT